jgi:hypothetical protein
MKEPEKVTTSPDEDLAAIYMAFRLLGTQLEEFIDNNTPASETTVMSEQDIHRLDKCSVVLKMAFKDIKRICRAHGQIRLKRSAHRVFRIAMIKNVDVPSD